MKEKLLECLTHDINTSSEKKYSYYPCENDKIMFIIEDLRNGNDYSERFTVEEFEIVKKIFKLE